VSTPVQVGSVPGFTWGFNPVNVLWADNCKLGNPACRCCDGSQWMKGATWFLVMQLLWIHLVCCSVFSQEIPCGLKFQKIAILHHFV
jgi:hypothetical protein